jgi:ribose 5-phosphate isomerase A
MLGGRGRLRGSQDTCERDIVTSLEDRKRATAARAVEFVQAGMRLGLGTGSTARHFIELLGMRVQQGLSVIAVPTSEATRACAAPFGIPVSKPG